MIRGRQVFSYRSLLFHSRFRPSSPVTQTVTTAHLQASQPLHPAACCRDVCITYTRRIPILPLKQNPHECPFYYLIRSAGLAFFYCPPAKLAAHCPQNIYIYISHVFIKQIFSERCLYFSTTAGPRHAKMSTWSLNTRRSQTLRGDRQGLVRKCVRKRGTDPTHLTGRTRLEEASHLK